MNQDNDRMKDSTNHHLSKQLGLKSTKIMIAFAVPNHEPAFFFRKGKPRKFLKFPLSLPFRNLVLDKRPDPQKASLTSQSSPKRTRPLNLDNTIRSD